MSFVAVEEEILIAALKNEAGWRERLRSSMGLPPWKRVRRTVDAVCAECSGPYKKRLDKRETEHKYCSRKCGGKSLIKTHCKRGHAYAEHGFFTWNAILNRHNKVCRLCHKLRAKRYKRNNPGWFKRNHYQNKGVLERWTRP